MHKQPRQPDPTPPAEDPPAESVRFGMAGMSGEALLGTAMTIVLLGGALLALIVGAILFDGALAITMTVLAALAGLASVILVIGTLRYARPCGLELSDEGMVIIWPWRTRRIPRNAFTEIRMLNDTLIGRLRRRMGVGAVFGKFGWYQSDYYGGLDAYVTRRDGYVYLRMANRRSLLLTPANPAAFAEELARRTGLEVQTA